MKDIKKKIIKNTVSNTLLKISTLVIQFLLFPFIIHYVGEEYYGLYLLVGAFVGYFGLLDFGVEAALVKYVAEYAAKGKKQMIQKIVNSTFLFYSIVGLVICISIVSIGFFFIDIFQVQHADINTARYIALFVGIGALTSWPLKSFGTILPGLQRYDISASISFVSNLINALVTVWLLLNGYGIIELIISGIIIGSVTQIAIVMVIQRLLPYLEIRRRYMKKQTMKKIFRFSGVVFISQLLATLMFGADRILLGYYVSISAITFYAIARKIHDVINAISLMPQSALLPATSELNAIREHTKIEKLVIRGGKYRSAVILMTTSIIFPLAGPIIQTWMGREYLFMTQPTQIFISYWFLFASWGVLGVVLLAKEKFKPMLQFTFLTSIPNLILSFILVQVYGLEGVIYGTVIPFIVTIIAMLNYVLKYLRIPFRRYFRDALMKSYLPAGITLLAVLAMARTISIDNPILLGIVAFIGIVIYGTTFFLYGMESAEKKQLLTMIGLKK